MRVAVIGGGATGLFLSRLLANCEDIEVTLFEKKKLGGNIHPVFVDGFGFVDLGFMVFNPEFYPIFYKLIALQNFDILSVPMSFSVTSESFSWSSDWWGHLHSARFISFRDWLQLNRQAFYLQGNLSQYENIQSPITSLVEDKKVGFFTSLVLLPLARALWSITSEDLDKIPSSFVIRFLKNHKMLSLIRKVRWYAFKNSSIDYLNSLINPKVKVKIVAVKEVTRMQNGDKTTVIISSEAGVENFDIVCFCCDPDQLKFLLKDPNPAEEEFVKKLKCSENKVYLHKDPSLMPNKSTSASWNFFDVKNHKYITYDLGKLQNKPGLYVTLNPQKPPKNEIYQTTLKHPSWSPRMEGKEIDFFSAHPSTFFAGAYFGWCFQEDALRSALAVFKSIILSNACPLKNFSNDPFFSTR